MELRIRWYSQCFGVLQKDCMHFCVAIPYMGNNDVNWRLKIVKKKEIQQTGNDIKHQNSKSRQCVNSICDRMGITFFLGRPHLFLFFNFDKKLIFVFNRSAFPPFWFHRKSISSTLLCYFFNFRWVEPTWLKSPWLQFSSFFSLVLFIFSFQILCLVHTLHHVNCTIILCIDRCIFVILRTHQICPIMHFICALCIVDCVLCIRHCMWFGQIKSNFFFQYLNLKSVEHQ